MTDDPTKDLTTDEMLRALLADVRSMNDRLSGIESAAEDRTRETRPKLDLIVKAIADLSEDMREVKKDLRSLHRKLDIFNSEMLAMKADLKDFDERLTASERRPN